jgi:hypothetical protein
MGTTIVKVWGRDVEITVYQKSKSVWIAVGDHNGESIEVKGASEGAAAKLWRETATYRSN